MPIYKGVQLSIVSQWELKIHPEFPNPDISRFKNSPTAQKQSPTNSSSANASGSEEDIKLDRQPDISVYVPSLPGARFWLRYTILAPQAAACSLWYFKLFMNGRHVSSWGINTRKQTTGQVMRALFEPSDRWNYRENSILYKNNGTECRPFFFSNEAEDRSAASDGGLIEVQVFRAKGRKRRTAQKDEFKPQEKYGIVMPSGGLLDKPQDAYYYDWYLIDPKGAPYAKFNFHYRSWDTLIDLQLIPSSHPRVLLPPTASLLALNQKAHNLHDDEEDWETEVDSTSPLEEISPSSLQESPATGSWMTDVFNDSPKIARAMIDKEIPSPGLHRTASSEGLMMKEKASRFSLDSGEENYGIEVDKDHTSKRPLPEVPVRTVSLKSREASRSMGHSRSSSRVSQSSNAVSITPSLRSYFDRDTDSPEHEIGVATVVHISKPAKAREIMIKEDPPSFWSLDTDLDPFTDASTPIEKHFHPKDINSIPEDDVPLPLNVMIRKHRRTQAKDRFSEIPDDGRNHFSTSLSESEWMCRTPSPIKELPDRVRVENLWSPNVETARSPDLEVKPLRKKALAWYKNVRTPEKDIDKVRYNAEVKVRSGNWI
ncbi:hypothetical protein BP5796_04780 [Coleophoma crateriformis]|uniref:Uncharacterized protein n=1 Tax=Coleophoma crateriformis TaxID=565419 RepID=A0A3D8SA98_9HELO|nr:hypothetical protein BP5796_04780 [Coleophoma crateriformis]